MADDPDTDDDSLIAQSARLEDAHAKERADAAASHQADLDALAKRQNEAYSAMVRQQSIDVANNLQASQPRAAPAAAPSGGGGGDNGGVGPGVDAGGNTGPSSTGAEGSSSDGTI